ncbi:BofC C-terminal domain-containing protein [Paenibacillus sp. FJAT-26967]|uniref:BofC C-terminal domain-containing protein n=1 Tax=Paenibacillus sp. FJAT-26967 TaxID=1729690 RepID=UPI000838A383|nr:BofC C-terminal domain-containing protein [Paenibacillus sp. FJAT-26967]
MVYNLLKQLKKKLRLKRKRLIFSAFLLLAGTACYLVLYDSPLTTYREASVPVRSVFTPEIDNALKEEQEHVLQLIETEGGKRPAFIQRTYVCGEEQEELGLKTAQEIADIHRAHPGWAVNLDSSGTVFFTQHIDDLSPKCKQNAYFGLDESGNLSLFDGLPADDKVIRTFFQLNIEYLESSLPQETVKQLHEGIRVSDVAEFNSVLSTFSDYAIQESEKVISPKY